MRNFSPLAFPKLLCISVDAKQQSEGKYCMYTQSKTCKSALALFSLFILKSINYHLWRGLSKDNTEVCVQHKHTDLGLPPHCVGSSGGFQDTVKPRVYTSLRGGVALPQKIADLQGDSASQCDASSA